MKFPRILAAVLCTLTVGPAAAHEFWLEPEAYQVSLGDTIRVAFKNGENFEGNALAYLDRSTTRHEMALGDGAVVPIPGRAGDRPAVQLADQQQEGLLVLAHETTPSTITYRTWEKFQKFVAHKDFATAEADHAAAGWPQEGFRETYTRHVKSLIAIGAGAGADRAFGLSTEFVALTNPYAPGFDGQMQVQLSYLDQPRPDAQIEVFERAPEGEVTVTLYRSDAEGRAEIPVKAGHAYLFDAVVLRKAPDPGDDPRAPLWESLWAGLSFAVPAK